MTTLAPIGVAASELNTDPERAVTAAAELAELGYGTLWLAGGQGNNLPVIEKVVRGTRDIQVASGILSVDRIPAEEVAAAYRALERDAPGRFLVGLGGAHGARPLATVTAYLDTLDSVPPTVPVSARVLSALGPRMLDLARDRASGAYPYLVTPEYIADARARLGAGPALAVLLTIIPEPDPGTARGIARESMRFLATVPGYVNNFRRMGFGAEDIAGVSDRLIDAVTAWGDETAIRRRLAEYRAAGADQVVLQFRSESPAVWWRRFADLAQLTG